MNREEEGDDVEEVEGGEVIPGLNPEDVPIDPVKEEREIEGAEDSLWEEEDM